VALLGSVANIAVVQAMLASIEVRRWRHLSWGR